ncbi:MAG TPA: hypothetical protein VER11_34295 [Polyangiaceae bacterium]|nr:hypothetical protein [Polyangiaceae bacterium]
MSNDEKQVKRPSSWDEMFPGRFLKAGLFKGKAVTLEISDVTLEELPSDKGPDQTRGVLSFKQTPLQLAINKTNGLCLRKMFGTKPVEWIGKRVTFVPELDKFGKETVDAIRIQGSPDIESAIDVEIRMPRKKPKKRRLVVTGKNAKPDEAPPPDSAPDAGREPDNDAQEPATDLQPDEAAQ